MEQKVNYTRFGQMIRTTKETDIKVEWDLDKIEPGVISTGIPFMDHMLELLSKHSFTTLNIKCKGDLQIDAHHTMEDLGLTMGSTLAQALGEKTGIRRYGHSILPMDEALAMVAIDLSGRPFLVWDVNFPNEHINHLDTRLFQEFFRALSTTSGMNIHIQLMKGDEVHHVFEAIFKGFAKALDQAIQIDPRVQGVLSTKGIL